MDSEHKVYVILIIAILTLTMTALISYHLRESETTRLAIQRGMVQVRTEGGSTIWVMPQQPAQQPKVEKP